MISTTNTEEFYPDGNFTMFPSKWMEWKAKNAKTYEERLTWCIFRLTISYHKLSAAITYETFKEMTRINDYRNIAQALKKLEDEGIIIIESYGQGKRVVYWLNTDTLDNEIDADMPPASFNQPLSTRQRFSSEPLSIETKHINIKSLNINTHNTSQKPVCVGEEKDKAEPIPVPKIELSTGLPKKTSDKEPELPIPVPTSTVSAPKISVPPPPSTAVMEPVTAIESKKESTTGRGKASLSLDTLRWLYNQYGQEKVLEVLAIIEFQGSKPQNYIGLVIHMCKNGYAIPNGYIPMAEKKVLEEKRRIEQEKRQSEGTTEATTEAELDKIYNALSEEERNRLLDEAKDSVKGMSPYHQRPFYLQYLVKEMLRDRLPQLRGWR
ncbi:MAG: hypothetical protein HQK96_10780 [Nitrospirae bacterium]|nr:hypothetical protein [Nitrospirota bacterium]